MNNNKWILTDDIENLVKILITCLTTKPKDTVVLHTKQNKY